VRFIAEPSRGGVRFYEPARVGVRFSEAARVGVRFSEPARVGVRSGDMGGADRHHRRPCAPPQGLKFRHFHHRYYTPSLLLHVIMISALHHNYSTSS